MRTLLAILTLALCISAAPAEVVRPAPDFTFVGVGNKTQSLRNLRGQPVVLVIAPNPKHWAFNWQMRNLRELYEQFATKQVVFIAAFSEQGGLIKSNIPVVTVNDGPGVAAAYGAGRKFNIAIIGKDGNLDYQTPKVLSSERVRDVIQNSFAVQSNTGRQ